MERIFVKDEPTVSELLATESVTRSHLKFHPVINLLQEEYNISSEKALELMEMAATENPFLLLEYTIPSMFTTEDDYLHTLAENLTLACELLNLMRTYSLMRLYMKICNLKLEN